MRLVLASDSPRRRELLIAAGFAVDVVMPVIDESIHGRERPDELVERLARSKAQSIAHTHVDDVIVAGDTVVVIDHEILGKPRDRADAARMLRQLSGRSHSVFSGIAVIANAAISSGVEHTTVTIDALADDDIAWYVATDEPLGKAGAYAIQGLGSRFVARIDGSYTNVVGLPIPLLIRLLREAGCRILQ